MKTRSFKDRIKSPYAKYGKKPFRYSDIYYQWQAAARAFREEEARAAAEKHARAFGYVLGVVEYSQPE